jgi:hypothetical protein
MDAQTKEAHAEVKEVMKQLDKVCASLYIFMSIETFVYVHVLCLFMEAMHANGK